MTDVAHAFPEVAPVSRSSGRWIAVWTKPRNEKAVVRALEQRAVAAWLPLLQVNRRWSDRWKTVELPLFPGYLFAQTEAATWSELLRVPGVLTVVKQGAAPAWIRDHQMVELRSAVDILSRANATTELVDTYARGDRVRILDGPLAGLSGTVVDLRGSRRLIVGIEQIGQAISISIGAAGVEHVGSRALPLAG